MILLADRLLPTTTANSSTTTPINEHPSLFLTPPTTTSLISLWPSNHSLETINTATLSFYSASQSLNIISKDFLLHQYHSDLSIHPTFNLSSSQFTQHSSFQCRGLSSSQLTPNSSPSIQTQAQHHLQEDSDYSSFQCRGLSSNSSASHHQPTHQSQSTHSPNLTTTTTTDPHQIIHASTQLDPTTDSIKPRRDPKNNHHDKTPDSKTRDRFELSRQQVSDSQDELIINIKRPLASHPHQTSSSRTTTNRPFRTLIPTNLHLGNNTGIFKCAVIKKISSSMATELIAFNTKRKKFQAELQTKIRFKFQRDQPNPSV